MTRDEKLLKELNEKFGGNVHEWVHAKSEENENFHGEGLIEEKHDRLMQLMEICMELSKRNREIIFTFMPFDNTHRHGCSQIKIPHFFYCNNKTIIDAISALYKLSDMVISYVGENAVLLTFTVADMWERDMTEEKNN